MTEKDKNLVLSIILSVVLIVLAVTFIASYDNGIDADEEITTQGLAFAETTPDCKTINFNQRFIWGHDPSSVGSGHFIDGPATVRFVEVVTEDSYSTRASTSKQESESVRIGIGGSWTAPSPDLRDFVQSAEWTGQLGSVSVPAGRHEIIAEHVPSRLSPDSVRLVSVCYAVEVPSTTTTTAPPTTTTSTTTDEEVTTTTQPGESTTSTTDTGTTTVPVERPEFTG